MSLIQLVCWSSCHLQLKCAAGRIHQLVFASLVRAEQASLATEPDIGCCSCVDLAGSNSVGLEPCRLLSNPCDLTSVINSPARVSVASKQRVTPQSEPLRPSFAWPPHIAKLLWPPPSVVMFQRWPLSRAPSVERAEPFSAFSVSLTSRECSLLFATERASEDTYLSSSLTVLFSSPSHNVSRPEEFGHGFTLTWPRWRTPSTAQWVPWVVYFHNLKGQRRLNGTWKF